LLSPHPTLLNKNKQNLKKKKVESTSQKRILERPICT